MSDERAKAKGRIVNWKFSSAMQHVDGLESYKSRAVLKHLASIWGDTGWASESKIQKTVRYLVDYIRLLEGWSE